ncbi:MAG: sulfur carrier protein ThiS [Oleiphilus sp.]
MKITLNGDAFEFDDDAKLADLITHLDLQGKRFAIEVNEEIISRSQHDSFQISEGDQVEVVQAIGGG